MIWLGGDFQSKTAHQPLQLPGTAPNQPANLILTLPNQAVGRISASI
jgi:hypothetical protein